MSPGTWIANCAGICALHLLSSLCIVRLKDSFATLGQRDLLAKDAKDVPNVAVDEFDIKFDIIWINLTNLTPFFYTFWFKKLWQAPCCPSVGDVSASMPQLMAMAVVKVVQLLCLLVASDFGAEFHQKSHEKTIGKP